MKSVGAESKNTVIGPLVPVILLQESFFLKGVGVDTESQMSHTADKPRVLI